MSIYLINDTLVTSVYERAQAAIAEASEDAIFRIAVLPTSVATELATKLSRDAIAKLIELSLWTSLEREEGHFHPFSIVLEPPNADGFSAHYWFTRPLEFTPTNLKKLAPAVDPNNYQIGVWFNDDGGFHVWGFKSKLVWFLSINSISPGKISFGCISGTKASFKCLVSLPQSGFLNPISRESNPIFGWLSGQEILTLIHKSADLNAVFARMFHEGYGGAVLLVPDNDEEWKGSIQQPLLYEHLGLTGFEYPNLADKYLAIREIEARIKSKAEGPGLGELKEKLLRAIEKSKGTIDDIYRLSTIDGATIISDRIHVLGFGAKIIASATLKTIAVSDPFENSGTQIEDFALWNVGTRHKSAANFVNAHQTSLAIVASEDRKLSVFSWSARHGTVHQLKGFELFVLG